MKKADISRRLFLAGATAVCGLALGAGFSPSTRAPLTTGPDTYPDLDTYKPLFFSDSEWSFIVTATDLLIPADDLGAGALAAHVPVFIDRQMLTDYAAGGLWYRHGPFLTGSAPEFGSQHRFTPRDIYRIGIAETDAQCRKAQAKPFVELNPSRQAEILKALEKGSFELETVPGPLFFKQLLADTREGFFADPVYGGNKSMIGWKLIGFPGARGDYGEFIRQHNMPYPKRPVSIEGRRGGGQSGEGWWG